MNPSSVEAVFDLVDYLTLTPRPKLRFRVFLLQESYPQERAKRLWSFVDGGEGSELAA